MLGLWLLYSLYGHGDMNTLLRLWEAAMRGMFEYTASWMHLVRVANGGPQLLPNVQIPQKPVWSLTGQYQYAEMSWSRNRSVPWTLLPITLVLLLTLVFAVSSAFLRYSRASKYTAQTFNPLSPLDLIFATSFGELHLGATNAFAAPRNEATAIKRRIAKVPVRLQETDSGGIGLISKLYGEEEQAIPLRYKRDGLEYVICSTKVFHLLISSSPFIT